MAADDREAAAALGVRPSVSAGKGMGQWAGEVAAGNIEGTSGVGRQQEG